MMDAQPPPLLSGIAEIANRYDGWLLDLWGTIHDGYRPLPGVIDCLERLREQGARIVILSNAPRTNAAVIARMNEIGIPASLYDAVLSSGESAHRALRDRTDPWHAALGTRVYHMGPPRDDSIFDGLALDRDATIAEADFILNTGLDTADETVADYEEALRAGVERQLPMLCANPDLVVLRGEVEELCAGALAARYEELGGEVFYHGKPHAPIYETCFDLLGLSDKSRIAAVGDSLRTDIAGARAAGIDGYLIAGGIHATVLGIRAGDMPDAARLAALCDEYATAPAATLAAFSW